MAVCAIVPNIAFANKFCITNPTVPIPVPIGVRRLHKKRRWMTEHYHQRIQKKWDKQIMPITVEYTEPNKDAPRMFGEDIFQARQQ